MVTVTREKMRFLLQISQILRSTDIETDQQLYIIYIWHVDLKLFLVHEMMEALFSGYNPAAFSGYFQPIADVILK